MSEFKMIAFDMDGTLLNREKHLTEGNRLALEKAFDAGKEVVLCTGRSVSELLPFFEQIPRLRYAVCVSGAFVYDRQEDDFLTGHGLAESDCRKIISVAGQEDTMLQFLGRHSILQRDRFAQVAKYHMQQYEELHRVCSTLVDSSAACYENERPLLGKINIYHTDVEARERSLSRLQGLPLEIVYAEDTGLECSPAGISKAVGLQELCEILQIPLAETIAVGDADNDLAALRIAGLPIAMGNANAHVKEVCKAVVADNEHDGCAEAVERFLL